MTALPRPFVAAPSSPSPDRAEITAEIRRRVPLLDLAREAVPSLRRAGAEWRGPCPLHHGRGLNFTVNPASGVWHCHSKCGRGGDVFDFVRLWRGLADFPAARAWLAERAGVPVDGAASAAHPGAYRIGAPARPAAVAPSPPSAPAAPVAWSAATTASRADAAAAWRARSLAEGGSWREPTDVYTALRDALTLTPAARAYLGGRGLDPDACAALGVRAVDDWTTVPALLDALGVDPWEAVGAGLDVAPAYTLPDGRTVPRPPRSASPVLAVANVPALVFFYVGRGGGAVGARLRSLASPAQLAAAGLDAGVRYLSLRGNQPRLPWGADALADCAGRDLHVTEGEPDALTLRAYGLRAVGLPGAQTVPGLAAGVAPARVPWLRAASVARRVYLWHDPDEGGDRGAPKLRDALQASAGWSAATAADRVVRVRPRGVPLPLGAKLDANALHLTGHLGALLERAGFLPSPSPSR